MCAGLLSAGGAAFFDYVFGGVKIPSMALVYFSWVRYLLVSLFANLFCWVFVSIILGGALALGAVWTLGGADFWEFFLFTLIPSSPSLPRFCWLSIVIDSIAGGAGGLGFGFVLLDLLRPENML